MAPRTATEQFVNWLTGKPMALFDAVGSTFGPAGAQSSIGLVPDPGAIANGFFLRDDGTWVSTTLDPGSVTNAQLADVPTLTFKGRISALTGSLEDLTVTQATSMLNAFVGDSGSGGTKGLVPAPAAGDAAANKYLKANGNFEVLPTTAGMVLLDSGVISSPLAALDIIFSSFTSYNSFLFVVSLMPETDASQLHVRFSPDGGSTFHISGYNWAGNRNNSDVAGNTPFGSSSSNQIEVTGASDIGNAANEGIHGDFRLINCFNAALWSRITWNAYYINSAGTPAGQFTSGGGANERTEITNAIRYSFSVDDIVSGTWAVYGYTI